MTRSAEDYLKQGNEFFKKGDFDKAIVHYTEAIRFNRDYASAFYNRSKAYEKKGDYEKAREDYDQAIYLNPDYADESGGRKDSKMATKNDKANEHFQRGLDYYDVENLDQAIEEFDKAIKIDPKAFNVSSMYYGRGLAYHDRGDFKQAIKDFTKCIEQCPKTFENRTQFLSFAHYSRGLTYAWKGESDLAIADFKKSLQFDPNYTEASELLESLESSKTKEENEKEAIMNELKINLKAIEHLPTNEQLSQFDEQLSILEKRVTDNEKANATDLTEDNILKLLVDSLAHSPMGKSKFVFINLAIKPLKSNEMWENYLAELKKKFPSSSRISSLSMRYAKNNRHLISLIKKIENFELNG